MQSFYLDRPVFVTGATGLLGGFLVQHLVARGADVTCLVRDWTPQSALVRSRLWAKVKTVRGDVRDQALIERVLGENEIDVVFHLAAQAIVPIANSNPVSTWETNVGGTWALLEACRRSPKVASIVVASSDKAYGEARRLPYDEDTPLCGRNPYDASKSCADIIAQSYGATYNMPIVVTRCGNFFGGGDFNWNRIVPGTIRSVLRGESPVLRSDGRQVRDFLYVEDGVLAYLMLAEKLFSEKLLRGQAYNVSYEKPISVHDIVERILSLMGSNLVPNVLGNATHEIEAQWLSSKKIRALGFEPQFELEAGLRATIDWYEGYFATEPPVTLHPERSWQAAAEPKI